MDLQESELRSQVCDAYSAASRRPGDRHQFPVGRQFASSVGYPSGLLSTLPAASVGGFCGVSNVGVFAEIHPGATVLDLGCGAGLDSLVAAERAGPGGHVIGIDFSDAMIERAGGSAAQQDARNVEFRRADAESLPVADDSVDVALVNGIFNLNPYREQIFRELARVVRSGGVLYGAEIVLREPPGPLKRLVRALVRRRGKPDDWFA